MEHIFARMWLWKTTFFIIVTTANRLDDAVRHCCPHSMPCCLANLVFPLHERAYCGRSSWSDISDCIEHVLYNTSLRSTQTHTCCDLLASSCCREICTKWMHEIRTSISRRISQIALTCELHIDMQLLRKSRSSNVRGCPSIRCPRKPRSLCNVTENPSCFDDSGIKLHNCARRCFTHHLEVYPFTGVAFDENNINHCPEYADQQSRDFCLGKEIN